METKLLDGVRIVDITTFVTGPLTTRTLSDCGAEVIKLDTRTTGTAGGRAGVNQHDTSKLSITLNFRHPKGLELAYRLIAKSDVVVENHAAGTLKRRGLGYDDLRKVKPDIIMLSSCMQGQTGPYAAHAAFGHQLTALSGFNHITGWPDREPGWLGPYTDVIAPRYNIIAILAALDYRRRTGKGMFLDVAQAEAGMQFMAPVILDYSANQRVDNRVGNEIPYAAPHNAYRCSGDDTWCAIAVFNDSEWQSFCRVIGQPSLSTDLMFSTLLARKENEEELDRLINEWTGSRPAQEVMTLMQEAGIAAGVAGTAEAEMTTDPQLKERHFYWEIEHPDVGSYRTAMGQHFLLSKTQYNLRRAHRLGEDNEYVFKDILGLSDAEIAELVREKAIE